MKFLSLALTWGLLSPSAFAQNIDSITGSNGMSDRRNAMIEDIASRLTLRAPPIAGLGQIQATGLTNENNPQSSSFFFKERITDASNRVLKEIKYGRPVEIDPTMTLSDLDRKIARKNLDVCVRELNKNGYDKAVKSDMDVLLTLMRTTLVANDAKAQARGAQKISAEEARLLGLLRAHLSLAPRNADGLTIAQILGDLQDLGMYSNRLRTLRFTRNQDLTMKSDSLTDNRVALSLSMLVSMRTRQDEAFVNIQGCLVDYLTEQKNQFATRLTQIQDPTQAAPSNLKYFMEGKAGLGSGEADFLLSRIGKINAVLPYLQGRLNGAVQAAKMLARLSPGQVDFLISTFLQLNNDDLPLPEQVEAVKQAALDQPDRRDLQDGVSYYRQTSRDLEALKASLIEESAHVAAKKQDLDAISKMRKP